MSTTTPRPRKAPHQRTSTDPVPGAPTPPPSTAPLTVSDFPEGLRGLVGPVLERLQRILAGGSQYTYWACYQSQTGAPPDWAWTAKARARLTAHLTHMLTDRTTLHTTILGLVAIREGVFTPDMLVRTLLSKLGEVAFYEVVVEAYAGRL